MYKGKKVIIVGAGICGLVTATKLQDYGFEVTVVDKGRGLGGRMATRRIHSAVCDHGAQFFTLEDERFIMLTQRYLDDYQLRVWHHNKEGKKLFYGSLGMTTLAKNLAKNLNVDLSTKIDDVSLQDDEWHLKTDKGKCLKADALVLTSPVPQSLALLSELPLAEQSLHLLKQISYDPCLALMATLKVPSRISEPGYWKSEDNDIAWIADNQRKGISPLPSITIHMSPDFSRKHWDDDRQQCAELILKKAAHLIDAEVDEVQMHGWLYSKAANFLECGYVDGGTALPLFFAGDAFRGTRVEDAAISGFMVADALRKYF